ncbi:nucleoside diphosphate kinase regulator [Loktanella salsilacus]|uniref:nucleoside diphosphate kinase regulator n=1 Tax=Loktanella salsilacus TaxID=195913 RepID=UPI0020B8FE8A|nr:nucleoside diphosphate kinase regulator [Loktanella salsilacus]UTH46726.1 nucleoside diphosphate kinase regulator [Loktanella salsilacus]
MNTPFARSTSRLPKIHLDRTLVGRLESLAADALLRSPDLGQRLMTEIGRAKLVAPRKLRDDIVTVGSKVTYCDLSTRLVHTVIICYPENVGIEIDAISVVSPVGVALLGLSAGSNISWETDNNEMLSLEVVTVKAPAT